MFSLESSGTSPQPDEKNDRRIKLITEICFGMQDEIVPPIDAIFVPRLPGIDHVRKGHIDDVVRLSSCTHVVERDMDWDVPNGVMSLKCFATEDAMKSSRVVFIAPWHMCGRIRLLFEKEMPDTRFLQRGYVCVLPNISGTVNPDYWYNDKRMRELLSNEFLQLQIYSKLDRFRCSDEHVARMNLLESLG